MELRLNRRRQLLDLLRFSQQQIDGTAEGTKKVLPVKRTDQCLQRVIAHARRKIVKPSAVMRRKTATPASEAESVITRSADPVLGLEVTTAFYAKASAQGVVYGVTKKLACRRR